ncbi:MAG: zinc-ribbon domain-containing protein, partial [Clostridium sp.]|uniref:zinc-ribbon domain-containing protein n=1 Tax=Clostridium sp. TaxID=1506 RepID=UPI003F3CC3D8
MGYINEKDINRGRACSVCSGAKVVAGINNIGKTHKWVGKFVKNKRDLDIYSCGSAHKIEIICPDCGYEYKQRINQLVKNNSYKCPRCSDGVSYPEKFMVSVLEQLGVEYKTQYLPKWIKPKKYDFYIKNLKCIIETHGEQHYSSISNFSSCGGRSLEEEQQNDKYKKEIAVKNGIK